MIVYFKVFLLLFANLAVAAQMTGKRSPGKLAARRERAVQRGFVLEAVQAKHISVHPLLKDWVRVVVKSMELQASNNVLTGVPYAFAHCSALPARPLIREVAFTGARLAHHRRNSVLHAWRQGSAARSLLGRGAWADFRSDDEDALDGPGRRVPPSSGECSRDAMIPCLAPLLGGDVRLEVRGDGSPPQGGDNGLSAEFVGGAVCLLPVLERIARALEAKPMATHASESKEELDTRHVALVSSLLDRVRGLEDGAAAQAHVVCDAQVALGNVAGGMDVSRFADRLQLLEDYEAKCVAEDVAGTVCTTAKHIMETVRGSLKDVAKQMMQMTEALVLNSHDALLVVVRRRSPCQVGEPPPSLGFSGLRNRRQGQGVCRDAVSSRWYACGFERAVRPLDEPQLVLLFSSATAGVPQLRY